MKKGRDHKVPSLTFFVSYDIVFSPFAAEWVDKRLSLYRQAIADTAVGAIFVFKEDLLWHGFIYLQLGAWRCSGQRF